MVALTVVAAAMPVVVVLSDPSTSSCDWGYASTTGVSLKTCEQHGERFDCEGVLTRSSYTVRDNGVVELHSPRWACSGAWVDPGVDVEPDPPASPPAPASCDRDPGMLYGVVWLGDAFTFGCASSTCPGDVWLQLGGEHYAPCVVK